VVSLMTLRRRHEDEWYTFHPSALEPRVETDKVVRCGSDDAEWCKIHPSTPKSLVKSISVAP
jgi:hypothetical protein